MSPIEILMWSFINVKCRLMKFWYGHLIMESVCQWNFDVVNCQWNFNVVICQCKVSPNEISMLSFVNVKHRPMKFQCCHLPMYSVAQWNFDVIICQCKVLPNEILIWSFDNGKCLPMKFRCGQLPMKFQCGHLPM